MGVVEIATVIDITAAVLTQGMTLTVDPVTVKDVLLMEGELTTDTGRVLDPVIQTGCWRSSAWVHAAIKTRQHRTL